MLSDINTLSQGILYIEQVVKYASVWQQQTTGSVFNRWDNMRSPLVCCAKEGNSKVSFSHQEVSWRYYYCGSTRLTDNGRLLYVCKLSTIVWLLITSCAAAYTFKTTTTTKIVRCSCAHLQPVSCQSATVNCQPERDLSILDKSLLLESLMMWKFIFIWWLYV